MEVSRLTFRKETKDKMKKEITMRERGRILFDRLRELDEDGTLSKATSRADVARLVGYSEERSKAGHAWISNLIHRGHLEEIVREWTPGGQMIAEYHVASSSPNYDYGRAKKREAEKKVTQELRRWQDKVAAGYIPQPPATQQPTEAPSAIITPIKIEIAHDNTTVKIEVNDYEQASKLITAILKGE